MTKKCGFISLIGPTNAGKSTLVNQLTGAKVSIVSHKVQTTRTQVRGILTHNDTQMILMDTPGIFKAKTPLDRAMISAAWQALGESDAILVLMDAQKGITPEIKQIIKNVKSTNKPTFIAMNKVDKVKKETLLALAAELSQMHDFKEYFMISALKNKGTEALLDKISAEMKEGPWLYDEDQVSDFPLKLFAAELVREKIYKFLHQELPYDIAVMPEKMEHTEKGYNFHMAIYAMRDSQKKIILGKGGLQLKQIGMLAREELERELEEKVNVFLFVKTQPNWQKDSEHYQVWGLEG